MSLFILHLPAERAQGAPNPLHLPYDDMPDATSATSQADMRRILRETRPDSPPETLAREADRLWACTHGVASEDILVIPLVASGEIAFAEAAGPVTYNTGLSRYELPVRWFDKRAKINRFVRFRGLFEKIGLPLVEVTDQQARVALRAQLPLKANRFARWRWLLAIFVGIQIFMLLRGMFHQ